ncbi:MAG: hypothetical protein WC178_02495 [Candidatus Paceibacterota bacterium]
MTKLYKCAKGCGSIEETEKNEIPVCCGANMVEISEDEVFGCAGCCSCCSGCGSDEEEIDEEIEEKK